MRLPTEREQRELRALNERLRTDLGKAAPVMAAALKSMFDGFKKFKQRT